MTMPASRLQTNSKGHGKRLFAVPFYVLPSLYGPGRWLRPYCNRVPSGHFVFAGTVRNIDAQGRCQGDLMILLVHQDLANLLGHREFAD